jgi:hypothetical protein
MNPGYAAVGIYLAGEDRPTLMSANGRVIVFDTPVVARNFLPVLGAGRHDVWDLASERVWFTPIDPRGVNRAVILTDYDPYNLPPGLPIRSEVRHREWRNHVHYSAWWRDIGQMVQRADGTWANTAIGEEVD